MDGSYSPDFAGSPLLVGGTPIYVSGEDALVATIFNAAAGVTAELTGRFLSTKSGPDDCPVPSPFGSPFIPATDRTASAFVQGLGEGWLLEASIIATAGTPIVGQCFAKLELQRGLASSAKKLSRLVAGYVTATQGIAWPGSPILGSLEGAGAVRSFLGTNPAAGSECSDAVPTGARWEVLAWANSLVTDANVATREVELTIDDGSTILQRMIAGGTQAASLTRAYSFGVGNARAAGGQAPSITSSIVSNRLLAGSRIRTVITNKQVGDDWGPPQILVREWMEGA